MKKPLIVFSLLSLWWLLVAWYQFTTQGYSVRFVLFIAASLICMALAVIGATFNRG